MHIHCNSQNLKTTNSKYSWRCGTMELWWNVKWYSYFGKLFAVSLKVQPPPTSKYLYNKILMPPSIYLRKMEVYVLTKTWIWMLTADVHIRTKNLEAVQMSISTLMDKQHMINLYEGILLSNIKKCIIVIFINTNKSEKTLWINLGKKE